MAGMSDGTQEGRVTFSSMRQPPLIKQLRGILSEYPDGGQILKELIQNAEDAGATVVVIDYDSRRVNEEPREPDPKYSKFFKGPALCVYNDAQFTEKDWEGIRMIYSSVKEEDRLTVGRFGLGFKSVFHITDYPCVLSGDKLLMIDPQQSSDKVNAMVEVADIEMLQDIELPAEVFWSSMENKFGLTRKCIQDGHFKGTIFRFPLREKRSELSETLYNEQKVYDLFDDFKSDSSSILLFLKSLESINLFVSKDNDGPEMFVSVEILDGDGKIKESRRKFKKSLQALKRDFKGEDIVNELQMTIRTTTNEKASDTEWIVVNYYVGSSASPQFRKLIEDKSIGYSPHVGIATPISRQYAEDYEGHVFCFLPLPKEGSKLTGLPVHVNGNFALSQSRHHLKQETDEQRSKNIDDKSILWNRYLITEAIPNAYLKLILNVVSYSTNMGNTNYMVGMVYHSWPQKTRTVGVWKKLEGELYKKLQTQNVFYSQHKDSWISTSEACFATFSCLSEKLMYVTDAVKRCMDLAGLLHVDVPPNIVETVKCHYKKVKDIRPDLLAKHLHRYDAYKTMTSADKLGVLTYLLSDKNCYQKLSGLELLPLVSGQWTIFNNKRDTVFMCDEEVIKILLGLENRLLLKSDALGKILVEKLSQLCGKDYCQLQRLNDQEFVKLIETSIGLLPLGKSARPSITDKTKLSLRWLKSLWSFLIKNKKTSAFLNAKIVPKLIIGTWENPQCIELIRMADIVLVKSIPKATLSCSIVRCFEKLGVTVIDALPDWIPVDNVKPYFFWPSMKGIVSLLEHVYLKTKWQETIDVFNETCEKADRESLVRLMSEYTQFLTEDVKTLLRKLKLFSLVSYVDGQCQCSFLNETDYFIVDTVNYPGNVSLPFPCILTNDETSRLVAEIGGTKLELRELILTKLKSFQKLSDSDEIPTFMQYFICQFHLFRMNDELIRKASNVPFLRVGAKRHKPGDLFDPSDSRLVKLLHGEGLIPETKHPLDKDTILVLQCMGLQNAESVDADVLLQVAKSLDGLSKSRCSTKDEYFQKAAAFMDFLKRRPSILHECCQTGLPLYKCIYDLECILPDKSNPQYPTCLTWYTHANLFCKPSDVKEASLCLLVGASMPTVSSTMLDINSVFGWSDTPQLETVFQQLNTVKKCYSIHVRPDVMPCIKALYGHLVKRIADIKCAVSTFDTDGLIWTDVGFQNANQVTITRQKGDVDLTPYFHSLPVEFDHYHELFKALGCQQEQNIDVLQDALYRIKYAHTTRQDEHTVKHDQRLVSNILDRIAYFIENGASINADKTLVLVHDKNKLVLQMCTVQECVYDDDPDFFYEDSGGMCLVHEMISSETVEVIGIKSITRKALMDAEELGVDLWEQQEHLTTRINSLLRDGYTDGLSVPKELIQNADDAGATTIKFLYDERQNADARQRVFSRAMTSFQGPALWVFNDAQFSEQDLTNITKLNGATKQQNVQTIGKFGLGFCSVYNLTDIPSFLTGRSIVFFDPHEKHLGNILHSKKTGLKYKLPNRTLIARHTDQFKTYDRIFGCNILDEDFETYRGTLFRLPLRTEQQARESKICSKSYSDDEMKDLLEMLIKNAGNMLLFSQNIISIEVYHLSDDIENPEDAHLIYKVDKECFRLSTGMLRPVEKPVLSRVSELLHTEANFLETHKSILRQQFPSMETKFLSGLELQDLPKQTETTWLTSWALGVHSSSGLYRSLSSEGAVPLASVSVPCDSGKLTTPLRLSNLPIGFYTNGHLFCFLPMPIKTSLQVHINGCFSVTSNRRQLVSISEDDKSSQKFLWNEALLKDVLVTAFINLLETIASSNDGEHYKYHDLWPLKCGTSIDAFTSAFYMRILVENVMVFKSISGWKCFKNICFMDSSLRKSDIGDIAFELLSRVCPRQNEFLVDIPEPVILNIRAWNVDHEQLICSKEIQRDEFLSIFLQQIHDPFWDDHTNQRNLLIVVALTCCEPDVIENMRNIECIPAEPNQRLRKPSGLINPLATFADLFSVHEEVFPLKSDELRTTGCLQQLSILGMCTDTLPATVLVDRCKSVQTLSIDCNVCAVARIRNIVKYLSQYNIRMGLKAEPDILQEISNIYMLPIMSKPKDWVFSWKADCKDKSDTFISGDKLCRLHCNCDTTSFILTKASLLFRKNVCDIVGTVGLVLNEDMFSRSVQEAFCLLSVRDVQDVTADMVIGQILTISDEYKETSQFKELLRLHDILMTNLDKRLMSNEPLILDQMNRLSEKAVILIGQELLEPRKVVFTVRHECKPYLYRLPAHDLLKRKHIYPSLGVKERFDVETIIEAMDELKCNNVQELSLVQYILEDIQEVLTETKSTYEDIGIYHERLLAPDTDGRLWPTYQLVTENETFQTGMKMNVLHPTISPSLGEKLGVKVKQLRCFEKISCGVSFGQREKLVTRIQGLLKSYPCDSSIMKELLQNADDAGASEIHFIKDYRSLSCRNLFSDTCEPLQGPSLCVFNNSCFTESDIEGIHDLGKGSKSDDPTRTGQYGVGFNAVYHLTDTPSFVTVGPGVSKDGLLFIFDPLCKHVPKATKLEPGMMCPVKKVKDNFPGQLLGFSLDTLIGEKPGTVFRFPLRAKESEISNNTVSEAQMDVIIQLFQTDMLDSLLFLKNIQRITVSNITTGTLIEEYSVQVKLSDVDLKMKNRFTDTIRKKAKENVESKDRLLCIDPVELIYPLEVFANGSLSKCWIIVQRFGVEGGEPDLENIKKSFRVGDLGFSPIGGVAIPVASDLINRKEANTPATETDTNSQRLEKTLTGRAFCFLPLPLITGLPVHVNGHFALDHESRRDLWTDGFRLEWNKCIIERIVIPAWLSGLRFVIGKVIQTVEKAKTWKAVNEEMATYHTLFPINQNTKDQFWRYVATTFYKYTIDNEIKVFPSVLKQTSENFDISLETINRQPNDGFDGVFNCITSISENGTSLTIKDCIGLTNLLKSFGLKLLEASTFIQTSIIDSDLDSGVDASSCSSPSLVIEFLKTFSESSNKTCDIGQIGIAVTNSKYRTVENVRKLLQFLLLDPQLCDKMVGLPIIVTVDGVVRECCNEYPVFLSRFSRLVPNSSQQFLNDSLLELLLPKQEQLYQSGCFKRFTFDQFVQMLPLNLQEDVFANGRAISVDSEAEHSETYLPLPWLSGFYEFLCIESKCNTGGNEFTFVSLDTETVLRNITSLSEWSFLPCTKPSKETVLLPFSNMKSILHLPITTGADENIRRILLKMDVPHLNVDVLNTCRCPSLTTCLQNTVASIEQPYCLMKCLLHHKDTIKKHVSTCKDGSDLLDYFCRSLGVLKKECDSEQDLANDLRQLPLYSALQGTLTALDNTNEILVIPRCIPKDGIQEWANACKVTLLQESYTIENIYEFLGLKRADVEYVYGERILPNIRALPERHIGVHVNYLKHVIERRSSLTPASGKILKYLSELAFINVEGVLRRADDLYDPNNDLFQMMFTKFEFPPQQYLSIDWMLFLKKLGLVSEVNDKLIMYFAREIERQMCNGLNEDVRRKSNTILRHLTNEINKWNETTLYELKTVRFLVPFRERKENTEIYPQFNKAAQPICFKGSVSSKHSLLCWSSTNLIPETAYNRLGKTKTALGVLENPTVDSVILHCQNVCQSLKHMIKETDKASVEKQMTSFYDYFGSHTNCDLSGIKDVHLVHLPDEKSLVSTAEIVIDIVQEFEIKPYLYRAPTYYGKYFELFEVLGGKRKLMFCHYAGILSKIFSKSADRELNPPERLFVQKALRGLFCLDLGNDKTAHELRDLYLPDENMILKVSRHIVLSNNASIEMRLRGKVEITYFAGQSFLHMARNIDFENIIQTWPEHLKPMLLTDLVTESVCFGESDRSTYDNTQAQTIERLLHSKHLILAICRLLKHEMMCSHSKEQFDASKHEKNISQRLQNVDVVQLSNLRTILRYNGRDIAGSEADISYHLEYGHSGVPQKFYFVSTRSAGFWAMKILPGLHKLVQDCAMLGLGSNAMLQMQTMLLQMESPHTFAEILDGWRIKPYDSSSQNVYFPEPGTYVEPQFIPFLEQGIAPFADYEYELVAMDLEDIPLDGDWDTLFIYVRIIGEVPGVRTRQPEGLGDLGKKYYVNTGNKEIPIEKVPIYRLYRFVRREVEPGALVLADVTKIDSTPFDQQCVRLKQELIKAWRLPETERKAILRRMLLQWHPDKNLDTKEYCSKVFHYLKIIHSRLLNGELMADNVDEEMFRGRSDSSQTTQDFYKDINRRATKQSRGYSDNLEEYKASKTTGPFSHIGSTSSHTKQRDIPEANRWLRQAKSDFTAAKAFLPSAEDANAYNWICKMCHQACETALKAAHYFIDRSRVPGTLHRLRLLAPNAELAHQAGSFDDHFGEPARLTYPDTTSRPNIPSNIFDKGDAEFALSTTKETLEMVDELISS